MSFGGAPDGVHSDKRTEAAVSFARKFIKDHHSLTDEDFSKLQALFTDQEISAL